MNSFLMRDSNAQLVQLMELSSPQTVTINASSGGATLSGVIIKKAVRLQATVDCFFFFTVATDVAAGTGHFLIAYQTYDVPVGEMSTTKLSVLGATAGAGSLYISELG